MMTDRMGTYRIELTQDLVKRIKHVVAEIGVTTKKFQEDAVEHYTQLQEALLRKNGKH